MKTIDDYITLKELRKRIPLTNDTLKKHLASLPVVNLNGTKLWRVKDVQDFLEANTERRTHGTDTT